MGNSMHGVLFCYKKLSVYRNRFNQTLEGGIFRHFLCSVFKREQWTAVLKEQRFFGSIYEWVRFCAILVRDHSFSTYEKFSEKLMILTFWYTHARLRIRGWEMLDFRKILRTYKIWSHLLKKSLTENFIFCAVFVGNLACYNGQGWSILDYSETKNF